MKMTHKQKVKLARKMHTWKDRRMGRGIFVGAAWSARAEAIRLRIRKKKEPTFAESVIIPGK